MAKREPKSTIFTSIDVVGRDGTKKGYLELSSGNLSYFRAGAQKEMLRVSYQQLISLLEKEIEWRRIRQEIRLPRPRSHGDFVLQLYTTEDGLDEWTPLFEASTNWKQIDPRRLDLGIYQFSDDMAKVTGRRKVPYHWYVQLSVQMALWIVHRYIEKFLIKKRDSDYHDEDVIVSKRELKQVLLSFLRQLGY